MIAKFGTFEHALANRYRFDVELGRGAMGVVYRAYDAQLDRDVAIKMLHPGLTDEVGVSRFQSEIRIAAKLHHPNIIAVHEAGEVDGHLFYSMDYFGGETLRARLERERQLSNADALSIVEDIAAALQYAHDQRIVHRDVKPENILLADGHAYILDFGLARALGEAETRRLTASGVSVGTPHYLSPEQASAQRDIGPKSDQYALACVLYEMLVGEPPFTGPTASAIAMRHIAEDPPLMRTRRRTTSQNIEAAVRRAMEKVPADRFDSVRAFSDAARSMQATDADSVGALARGGATDRRASWLWASRTLAGLGVGIVVAAVVAAILHLQKPAADGPTAVVIFPLHVIGSDAGGASDIGESASLLIGYRLAGTPGMQFPNAADHLVGAERTGQTDLTLERKRQIAHSLGANRLIDGWVQSHGDSLTVVLRLQSTDAGTPAIEHGVTAAAAPGDAPRLALVALRMLLPAFLDPGRRVDQSALERRDPAAIAAFLEGEREYRESHFTQALVRYDTAIQHDSLLAVAELKAAQAASWMGQMSDANEYVGLAIRHVDLLPTRYATYAHALQHFLRGDGDSAVAAAKVLVAGDPRWTDAWFLLGEAYYHLMPRSAEGVGQLSLADSAFRMAGRADSAFTPATHHLLDIALRRGDARQIDSLFPRVRLTLDARDGRWLDAVVRCVREGPASVDWPAVRRAASPGGTQWGKTLVFDPARAGCAQSEFAAALASSTAAPSELWAAIVGTNASLIVSGRSAEAARLLESAPASKLKGWALFFPDASADSRLQPEAKRLADSLGTNFPSLATPYLWLLTSWYSTAGDSAKLDRIVAVMETRRDSTHRHLDSLVARVASAHAAASRHDTTRALVILESMRPAAPYVDLMWQPWEAFAGERMLEASLLSGRGNDAAAIRAAARIDVQVPVINLVYLGKSLQLREQLALRLGDTAAAAEYRRRLAAWSSPKK